MKKPFIVLTVLVVVIAGSLAYFLLSANNNKETPEVKLPSEETVTAPKEKNTVTIKEFTFNPDTLTVKVGEVVTWVNEDGVVHAVNSSAFNSPNIKNGESYKFQFTTAGTYEYSCGIHPYMKGRVVVE
jgi:plastocyanin